MQINKTELNAAVSLTELRKTFFAWVLLLGFGGLIVCSGQDAFNGGCLGCGEAGAVAQFAAQGVLVESRFAGEGGEVQEALNSAEALPCHIGGGHFVSVSVEGFDNSLKGVADVVRGFFERIAVTHAAFDGGHTGEEAIVFLAPTDFDFVVFDVCFHGLFMFEDMRAGLTDVGCFDGIAVHGNRQGGSEWRNKNVMRAFHAVERPPAQFQRNAQLREPDVAVVFSREDFSECFFFSAHLETNDSRNFVSVNFIHEIS